MATEQDKFLNLVAEPALTAEARLEIPAAVIIAQAALESGWGKSTLFTEANNPFGIKNRQLPDDYGEYIAVTREYEQGKFIEQVAAFEKFRDLETAFFFHSMLFWQATRYTRALEARRDPQEFARRIGPCGYSTDPGYGEKLISIMAQYKLASRAQLYAYAGAGSVNRQGVEGTDL